MANCSMARMRSPIVSAMRREHACTASSTRGCSGRKKSEASTESSSSAARSRRRESSSRLLLISLGTGWAGSAETTAFTEPAMASRAEESCAERSATAATSGTTSASTARMSPRR
jgi:hypothetical protein